MTPDDVKDRYPNTATIEIYTSEDRVFAILGNMGSLVKPTAASGGDICVALDRLAAKIRADFIEMLGAHNIEADPEVQTGKYEDDEDLL